MGFYGNIRNTTSNSFKFDRIYSNRTLMEQHANDDGVFGGRYVLVEYDQSLEESPVKGSETVYKIRINGENKFFRTIATSLDPFPEAHITDEEDADGNLIGQKVFYIKFEDEITQDLSIYFPRGTVIYENAYVEEGGNYTLYYKVGENPRVFSVEGVQLYSTEEETFFSFIPRRFNEFIYSSAVSGIIPI